jgi:hypothetical protein
MPTWRGITFFGMFAKCRWNVMLNKVPSIYTIFFWSKSLVYTFHIWFDSWEQCQACCLLWAPRYCSFTPSLFPPPKSLSSFLYLVIGKYLHPHWFFFPLQAMDFKFMWPMVQPLHITSLQIQDCLRLSFILHPFCSSCFQLLRQHKKEPTWQKAQHP